MAVLIRIFVLLSFTIIAIKSDYLGRMCYLAWGPYHWTTNDGQMTVNTCIEHCINNSYTYAGLFEGFQCYCDNDLNNYTLCTPFDRSASCSDCLSWQATPCTAENSMICGGSQWYSIYDANFEINTCQTQTLYVCPQNSVCNWTCNVNLQSSTCDYKNYNVQGTQIYSSQSGYCAAALHNGRYNLGNTTVITLQRRNESGFNPTGQILQGSWNRGILSYWDQSAIDIFVFLSSAVSDPVTTNLNLVSIDLLNLSAVCYSVDSSEYNLRLVFPNGTSSITVGGQNISYPLTTDVQSPVRAYCSLISSDSQVQYTSTVIPFIQPVPTNGGDSFAQYLTYTVAEGSKNVSITFTTNVTNNVYIRKSNEILPAINSLTSAISYIIPTVSYEDEGIYELGTNSSGQWVTMATTRLIVISNYTLSISTVACNARGYIQNGTDNQCICTHPFYGPECENVMPTGYFGPNGQFACTRPDCQNQVICYQDPVGCHCASGWTGANCSSPCPNNTYGTDCIYSLDCHCNGTFCDPFNGFCPEGVMCEPFYYGSSCTEIGPWLTLAPFIEDYSYDFITVGWLAWNETVDTNQLGPPSGYILTYDNATNGTEWEAIANFNATDPTTGDLVKNFTYKLNNLTPRQTYSFSTRTIFNETVQKPSPSVGQYLPCSAPVGVLTNFTYVYDNATTVKIQWQLPDSNQWRCDTVQVLINVSCDEQCGPSSLTSKTVTDPDTTSVEMNVSSFAFCYLSGILVTPDSLYAEQAVYSSVFRTSESVPSVVQSLQSYLLDDGSLLLAWAPPMPPNGKLLSYRVVVNSASAAEHYVEQLSNGIFEADVNSTTCLIGSDILAEQPLQISVYASTDVGEGPPVTIDYPDQGSSSSTDRTMTTTSGQQACDYKYYWITIVVLAVLVLLLVITLIVLVACYFCKKGAVTNSRISTSNAHWQLEGSAPNNERRNINEGVKYHL